MPSPSEIAHALNDPMGAVLQLVTGVLGHVVSTARGDLDGVLNRYLFSTVDPASTGRPLTANPTVVHLNATMAVAADVLVAAVVLFASLRSMFEHQSMRPRYTLKVVLPRLLVAIALVHGSIYFMQMAIDLNNAIGAVALSAGGNLTLDNVPWSMSLDPASVQSIQLSQDLFHAIFAVGLVVALVILALSYVVRTALLEILIVIAPLACLCTVLPDTRPYARHWLRLFVVTVFMQAVQLIILRVATATAFTSGDAIAGSLYALATLWIMLKVPGALHSAGHIEYRAHSLSRHVERSVKRALTPAHHAVRRRAST
jgi:hypothetical protein